MLSHHWISSGGGAVLTRTEQVKETGDKATWVCCLTTLLPANHLPCCELSTSHSHETKAFISAAPAAAAASYRWDGAIATRAAGSCSTTCQAQEANQRHATHAISFPATTSNFCCLPAGCIHCSRDMYIHLGLLLPSTHIHSITCTIIVQGNIWSDHLHSIPWSHADDGQITSISGMCWWGAPNVIGSSELCHHRPICNKSMHTACCQ